MALAEDTDIIDSFEEFYRTYYRNEIGELARKYPNDQRSLYISWTDLYRFDPELAEQYRNQPGQLQEYAEEALRLYDLPVDVSLGQAHVRIRDLDRTTDIRAIRARHRGQLISVQGIVRKATDVRPKIQQAAFECQRCGTLTRIPQTGGDFQEPHECQGCERQGPFRINFDQSEFVDAQKLRVQESPEGLRGGETPQNIDVHVEDDVTGRVTAGDHVKVTGILRLDQQESGQKKSAMFDIFMDGISIEIEDEQFEEMDITDEEKREIVNLSNESSIYEQMVGSLAPSIWGYEEEKLAIVLQLFSGVTKHLPDGSRIRGDFHMLLIGDPGTGKSALLQYVRNIAPRSVYTSGKGSSAAGLTAAAVRDDFGEGQQWSLEAGALVLADQGIAAIDELDKMRCVTGDTLVHLGDGRVTRIREVAREAARSGTIEELPNGRTIRDVDAEAWTMTDDGRLVRRPVTAVHAYDAPDDLVEVTLESGEAVTATSDHPFFVFDGGERVEKAAAELGHDDWVYVPRRLPHPATDGGTVADAGTVEADTKALDAACERVGGDRTILDVVPACGDLLSDLRDSLRLYQSECGLNDATYCNFENGDANVSLRLGRTVLDAFEARRRDAAADAEALSEDDRWETLSQVKERYHVSQLELASGTSYSQSQVSQRWGDDDDLRETVRRQLREVVAAVADTDLAPFRDLVRGDVKWRRVASVEPVAPGTTDDRTRLLRGELADLLGCTPADAVSSAERLLAEEPTASSWDELRAELDRHGVSFEDLADDLGVAGSTVSRWFDGVVETDRFPEVRATARAEFEAVRTRARALLDELEARGRPKVYDLTVEGTHNFVANGMVVHNSEDRSAMHEALEQQSISISKAGINATLKSRCALLGAANPKYGRFDEYESIGEQIELEPALISRFDLIFTITDKPDPDRDRDLAKHILTTNYAGELHTHRTEANASNVTQDEVDTVTEGVEPAIDADLLRKYIAYAKRTCFPVMTEEAREEIEEFYVDLRSQGADGDAPVPVTARKLEGLVRLAEASARVRLSDSVDREDAQRVIDIVRSSLEDIGMDPETGEFDADIVETGTSKTQRDRIRDIKGIIGEVEGEYDEGAPVEEVLDRAEAVGIERSKAEHEIEKLRRQGDVYEPQTDYLRTV
ncbi:XRE family transcriptional regulator [Halomarina pelagica]|uniref:XRE family transcriptional regulator n=1 Tax=Halomarina pelagica TaxID=2961599 RepID=UPI0020C3FD8B|nr:XRE family transcriptional regulator [Halomarina sp. BND7]